MPGIKALVQLISLDTTTRLVASGRVARALTITGATNASPIIVGTSVAHGFGDAGKVAHVVVSSVGGNAAANGTWVAVVVSDISLALYELGPTGALTASTGDGEYTSGGTLSIAWTDGRVLLGREHVMEQSAPPRAVFIPVSSPFSAKSVYNASRVVGAPSAEQTRQIQQRSIRTETVSFEVHVWGQAVPADPEDDFDATQALYHAIIQSTHELSAGTYDLRDGTWADQIEQATQIVKAGHEFVFGLSLGTPILGTLLPLAPSDVAAAPTTYIQIVPGGSPAVGCTG